MKLNDLQVSIINNFLNLLVHELANNYLNKLKKFKAKEVDEFTLQFLDNSVFLANEKIDITNDIRNSTIVRMNAKEQKKFERALAKKNSYSSMCKMLNFIYVVIKEEKEQEILFKNLYTWYDKNEENLIEKKEIDMYKEVKPWLLSNNNNVLYNGKLNRI